MPYLPGMTTAPEPALLTFITDFADTATMLPIAAAVLVLLLALGELRNALLWCLAVGIALGTVLVLKLTFAACLPPSPLAALHSASGHTVSATVIYGGLPAVLGLGLVATLVQSVAVGAVIGVSRVLLHHHSVPEALIGGGMGLCGSVAIAALWRPVAWAKRRRLVAMLIPLAMLVLAVVLHGIHWPTEQIIRHASSHHWPLHACRG